MRAIIFLLLLSTVAALSAAPPQKGAPDQKSPRRKAAGVLVDTPQHAVLWHAGKKPARIWLERLSTEELKAKPSSESTTEKTWAAGKDQDVRVKLLDGTAFSVNPNSGFFERFDELSGRYLANSSIAAHAADDDDPALITQVAEGTGTTESEALTDAFRNAVRLAVGVLVDSEVLLEKDDVISDKVLSFSDGFILRYDELSKQDEDGLVRIEISAVVEERKLMANLTEAKVCAGHLDGKSLVAAATTLKDSRDAAGALLAKKVAELPDVLDAEMIQPGPLDYNSEKRVLTVTFRVQVNMDKYKVYMKSFTALAKKLSLAKTSLGLRVEPVWSKEGKRHVDGVLGTGSPEFRFGPDLRKLPNCWCLWLLTQWDEKMTRIQWTGYALEAEATKSLASIRGQINVELQFLDDRDELIHKEVQDPMKGLQHPGYWFGWVRSRPREYGEKTPKSVVAPLLMVDLAKDDFDVDRERTVNVCIAPMCYTRLSEAKAFLAPGVWHVTQINISPEDLARVKAVVAKPVFVEYRN